MAELNDNRLTGSAFLNPLLEEFRLNTPRVFMPARDMVLDTSQHHRGIAAVVLRSDGRNGFSAS